MMSQKSNLQEIISTHCLISAMTQRLMLSLVKEINQNPNLLLLSKRLKIFFKQANRQIIQTLEFPTSFSKKQKQILIHGPTKSLLVTITIQIGMTRNLTYQTMIGTKTDSLKLGSKFCLKTQIYTNKGQKCLIKSLAIKTAYKTDNITRFTVRVTTKQEIVLCLPCRAITDFSRSTLKQDM